MEATSFPLADLTAEFNNTELKNNEKTQVLAFCETLRKHGFAKVSITAKQQDVLSEMFEYANQFYLIGEGTECPYKEDKEIGYLNVDNVAKEFFAIRLNPDHDGLFKLPGEDIPSGFETLAVKVFRLLEEVSMACLRLISVELEIEAAKLEGLVDLNPLPSGTFSSSFLHVFKYRDSKTCDMPCPSHTDSGLVTVIPCATSPGLEVLDWSTFRFCKVEENAAPTDVVVLIGETMARLSCMHYQAGVHRVMRDVTNTQHKERFSLPFQLRGRPSAMIDSVGLQSPVLGEIPHGLREVVSIEDFIN